jgi:hypothetical protein
MGERSGIKGWQDLDQNGITEAVTNSDERTFGVEGVDPYMVISRIVNISTLSDGEKNLLIAIVKNKAGLGT